MNMKIILTQSRWKGRLVGMLYYKAIQMGIDRESLGKLTLMELLLKVYPVVTPEEKSIIDALNKKIVETGNIEGETKSYDAQQEEQIGFNEVIKVRNEYGNFSKVIEDVDYHQEEQKRQKKKNIITLSVIGVLILSVVIYNLPYFKELRFYNKVVKENSEWMCEEYIEKFPEGRHIEDIYMMKINITQDMTSISTYISEFPEGKYVTRVNQVCDSLWDVEIEKYNAKDKSQSNLVAVKYMDELLQYMKIHRINTINLSITPDLRLKDFDSYEESVKALVKSCYEEPSLPFDNNLISITEEFTSADNNTLCEILSEGLSRSLNRIFTPGFLSIVTEKDEPSVPQVTFNYTIANQEEKGLWAGIPVIWTYSEGSPSYYGSNVTYTSKAYLIGISIHLDATFTIPNSSTIFHYTQDGEPSENISGIKNIKDGYRRMTTICFMLFSNEMTENLGLESIY